ncbi:hypothetical protein CHUAL_002332 [Chamberlinius hualienensis]
MDSMINIIANRRTIDDGDHIPDQTLYWEINTRAPTKVMKFEGSRYKMRLKLTTFNKKCYISVYLFKKLYSEGFDELIKCTSAFGLRFKDCDKLGKTFDCEFGQRRCRSETPLNIGSNIVVIDRSHFQLNGEELVMEVFKPAIASDNGMVSWKIEGICELKKNLNFGIGRTVRGPTFYTDKDGYRVKVELEFAEEIILKITFLAGLYDCLLPKIFDHLTNIILLNKSGNPLIINHNHTSEPEKSYSQILGTLEDLIDKGLIFDNSLHVVVLIKAFNTENKPAVTSFKTCAEIKESLKLLEEERLKLLNEESSNPMDVENPWIKEKSEV